MTQPRKRRRPSPEKVSLSLLEIMGFPKRNKKGEIKWNCLDAPNWKPKLIRLVSSVWGQKPLFLQEMTSQ